MKSLGALLVLCALGTVPSLAQEDLLSPEAHAACAKVAQWKPGPEAIATPADAREWKSDPPACSDFLDGINGQAQNYEKARRCCLARGNCSQILAMIFANGWGVRRDYDAATYVLCKAEEGIAPAEVSGMLAHIAAMRVAKNPEDLDYCAEVTSGFGMQLCQARDNDRAAPKLDARIAAIEKPLDPAGKKALAALRTAANAFADAEGSREAEDNRGGTIYPSVVLGATQQAFDRFVDTLERLSKARATEADAAAAKRADDGLNAAFRQARQAFEKCEYCQETETERREVLRDAQRAWIVYRDAWKAFYQARWKGTAPPAALDREITTVLSVVRTEELLAIGKEEEGG